MPPIRLIVAALLVAFCGFSKSLPINGQQVAATPAAVTKAAEKGDSILKRQHWFYDQRAYPLKHSPAGVRQRAVKAKNAQLAAQAALQASVHAQVSQAAPQWTLIGPQPVQGQFGVNSGRVTALAVDPTNANTVYAGGAEGGVWKTTDGGTMWKPLTDNQPSLAVGSIAIDPTNVNTIYVGTGEQNFSADSYYGAGVLKSTNGGATWTQYCGPFCGPELVGSSLDGGAYIGAIAVDPHNNQIVLAAVQLNSAGGVYRSTNGGATWSLVTTDGNTATSVLFDPVNTGVAYAASLVGGILKSTNHGQTWTASNGSGATGLPASNGSIALAIAPSTPATLYASFGSLGFYKTTTAGASWTQLTATPNYCENLCSYDNTIGVSPVNANIVFAGGTTTGIGSAALRSLDGGNTWSDQGSVLHPDAHAMAFSADGSVLYTGNDGGVWSTNGPSATTVNWTSLNATLAITEFYLGLSIDPSDVNHSYAGSQGNGIDKYAGSLDWLNVGCGSGGATAIDPLHTRTVYWACDGQNVDKSMDDGATYDNASTGIALDPYFPSLLPLTMDLANPSTLYFGTSLVYQTTNSAGQWTPISPDLVNPGGNVNVITVAPSNSNVVYVGTSEVSVWVTHNALSGASATWTKLSATSLPDRAITSIAVDPQSAATAYVGFSGFSNFDKLGHIFMTSNYGSTWTDVSSNLPNTPVNAILVDPDVPATVFIGTDLGAYYSSNSGASWSVVGTGLPNVVVMGLGLHENSRTLRASTYGRSVWDLNISTLLPVATVSSISPVSVAEGSAPFTLTVYGDQFAPNAVVAWNGAALATTYVSASVLTANVPASLLMDYGTATIAVLNPTTLSNTATLTITQVASTSATTLKVSPASGALGSNFTLSAVITDRGGAEMTGTVSFYDGADLLGTVYIRSQANAHGAVGTASLITRSLLVGANAITAKFNRTVFDSASVSAAQDVTVSGTYPTATTLTASGLQGSYQLNAGVFSGGLGTPTGTVTFTDVTTNTTLGTAAAGASNTTFIANPSVVDPNGGDDVALGDLRGIGIQDLVGIGDSGGITVALGNGNGTFASPTLIDPSTGNNGVAITLADLNGDGNLDIIGSSVYLGNGDGTFRLQTDTGLQNTFPNSLAVADFNGDGKQDIVMATGPGSNPGMIVLLGRGDGTFQKEYDYPTADTDPRSVTVGDYNGDGKVDAAILNEAGTISVFLGNGDGTFTAKPILAASSSGTHAGPRALASGDMNSDGILDLVLADRNGQAVDVLFGNGDGTFQAVKQFHVPNPSPVGVVVADFNRDGKPDLAVSAGYGNAISVLLNNGNQTFQAASYAVDYFPSVSLAVGDLNGDGIQDIAVAISSVYTVDILLGQTTFTTSLAHVTLPGSSSDTVIAKYSGDTHFSGSTSNSLTLPTKVAAAATPTFSPVAGHYTTTQFVKLADATAGTTLYYTTDGSTPTTASTLYTGGFSVFATETIEAIAVATGLTNSAVGSAVYSINVPAATPTITLATGTYSMPTSTTITDYAGTTLFYCTSTSGSCIPGTTYTSAVTINASPTEYLCANGTATGYALSATVCHVYTNAAAAAPTFSPAAGTYATAQTVKLADATAGATLYYTTNGSTPTTASTRYTAAIAVSATETIKAIAVVSGYNTSAIAQATFTISAATPTITLATGTYTMPISTTITGSAGTKLFYCTSTSGNCTPATAYTSAVIINASPTEYVCAYGTATGYGQSATVCHVYTNAATTAATPTFSQPAGTYTGTQTIALADATPGATIYYTTNGTAPTTASARYTAAITVTATEKIEAIAVAPGYTTSTIAHATFTIQ